MSSIETTDRPAAEPRRKRKKLTMTPAALAARRANLVKARAAPKEIIYRATAKRQAAQRANFLKAVVAPRTPEGLAARRMNALKHGLFAERVEESVTALHEDPQEYAEHLARFERVFVPEDEVEQKMVRRLANLVWRRLRLYQAIPRWEKKDLQEFFARATPNERPEKLTAEETRFRALDLAGLLGTYCRAFDEGYAIHVKIEAALRALIKKRSGGKMKFRYLRRHGGLVLPEDLEPETKEPPIMDYLLKIEALKQTPMGREFLRAVWSKAGIKRPVPEGIRD